MKPIDARVFFALVMLVFLFSCKVYRDIENINPKTSKEVKAGPFDKAALAKLVPGEKIIVNTLSGFKYHMTFEKIEGEYIVGIAEKVNKTKVFTEDVVEIPIQEIDTLYAWKKSTGVTIPVFVAAGVLAGFAIFLLVYALSGGMDIM